MSSQLLEKSQSLRQKAGEIVKELQIIKLFSGLGEVHFVGSYFLNLMFRPDIDIIVLSEIISKTKATDLTRKLIGSGYFQTVGFADWYNYPKQTIPRGFYWELVLVKNNLWWKMDVWYLSQTEDYSIQPAKEFESLLENNPRAKEIILQLKEKLFDGVKYKYEITAFDIYCAVLKNGIKDIKGLKVFAHNKKVNKELNLV